MPAQGNQANTRYSGRTSDQDRTSDDSQGPDDRTPPDVRYFSTRAKSTEVRRLPDVRTFPSLWTTGTHRTSDACLRTVYWTESMYPRTYPFVAHDYIYSSTSS